MDEIFFYSNVRICKFSLVFFRVIMIIWMFVMRKNLNLFLIFVFNLVVLMLSLLFLRLDMIKNFLLRLRRWKKWGKKYWFLKRIEFLVLCLEILLILVFYLIFIDVSWVLEFRNWRIFLNRFVLDVLILRGLSLSLLLNLRKLLLNLKM